MNKKSILFYLAFAGAVVSPVLMQAISLREWIGEHGQPQVVDGRVDLVDQDLTSLDGLDSLENPEAIRVLHLNNNQLQSVPESISRLVNLQRLYLYFNKLQNLPEIIGDLVNLQGLYVSHNNLQSIPASVGKLSNLRGLYLYCNRLQSMPNSIGNLAQLENLNLSHNKLKRVPKNIGRLRKLQQLDFAHNNLQSIPESMSDLTELQELWLQSNQLPGITNEILIERYLRGRIPPRRFEFRITPEQNEQARNERRLLDIVELRNPQVHPSIRQNVAERIREIAQQLPSIAFRVEGGNTLLHKAVIKRDPHMVHLLLSIDHELIAIKNNLGETPVEMAVGFEEITAVFTKIAEQV